MTPHRNKDTGEEVTQRRRTNSSYSGVGGVKGTLADLRTPEPAAVRCTVERQGGVR